MLTTKKHLYNLAQELSNIRSEEHTSEPQSRLQLVCRLLLEKKKTHPTTINTHITTQPNSSKPHVSATAITTPIN